MGIQMPTADEARAMQDTYAALVADVRQRTIRRHVVGAMVLDRFITSICTAALLHEASVQDEPEAPTEATPETPAETPAETAPSTNGKAKKSKVHAEQVA